MLKEMAEKHCKRKMFDEKIEKMLAEDDEQMISLNDLNCPIIETETIDG